MDQITRVGVDLAKRVMQVHAVNAAGRVMSAEALARDKLMAWCVQLSPGCLTAMEACSGGHHWARKLKVMGLDAQEMTTANEWSPAERLVSGPAPASPSATRPPVVVLSLWRCDFKVSARSGISARQ
jgi:hypothetical protein